MTRALAHLLPLVSAVALAALPAGCDQQMRNNPNGKPDAPLGRPGAGSPYSENEGEYRKNLEAGQKAIDSRDYDLAVSHLKRAVAERPNEFDGHFKLGWAYADKKDYEQAIREYTEAIRINPKSAAAYNNRGNLYSSQGNKSRAIEDYSEAIRLEGNDTVAYLNRASLYNSLGQRSDAIRDYTKVIELDPPAKKKAEAYWERGGVYSLQGNRSDYRADRERAMNLDPDYQARTAAGDVRVINNSTWAVTVDVEKWVYPDGTVESFSLPYEYKFSPGDSAYLLYNGRQVEARSFHAVVRTSRGSKRYYWNYKRGMTLEVHINNGDLP